MFKRIIVAFDGSGPARAAARVATGCASRWQAKMILCYALDVERLLIPSAVGAGSEYGDILEIYRREAADLLVDQLRQSRQDGLDCETMLRDEAAPEAIINAAREQEDSLIVIGTHAKSGLERAFLGSVAENVLRHAPVPVMTVRDEAADGVRFEDIVVAVDRSACAAAALDVALSIAGADRARVHMLHVVPDGASREMSLSGMEHLHSAATRARSSGVEVFEYDEMGDPAAKVCAFAKRIDAKLIAVGSHGRSGIARAMVGSVAEGIVRHAGSPVLVAKHL